MHEIQQGCVSGCAVAQLALPVCACTAAGGISRLQYPCSCCNTSLVDTKSHVCQRLCHHSNFDLNSHFCWHHYLTNAGAAVGHSSTVWSVAFSRDGRKLASVSDDCTLRVWSVEWSEGCPPEPHCSLAACISGHHSRCIFTVDWSAQGLIATGRVCAQYARC